MDGLVQACVLATIQVVAYLLGPWCLQLTCRLVN